MSNNQKKKISKNYMLPSLVWTTYKKILTDISKVLGVGLKKGRIVSGYDLEIEVVSKNCYPILMFLKKHTLCQYKQLVDIICFDTPGKNYRFFIIYNLLTIQYNTRIQVITKLKNTNELLSISGLYKSANWSEREIFDFFGVFFFENMDLRRILTDYGFKGFPLRKDFPLTGYIDVYYDDDQKRVCYKKLKLLQQYRNFNFRSSWQLNK